MITSKNSFQLFLVFVVLLSDSDGSEAHPIGGAPRIKCKEKEAQALRNFKRDLTDEFDLLSSWGSEEDQKDCCEWRGVYCDNRTGNVVELDLHGSYKFGAPPYLSGNISHSLLELKHLEYLDLSSNNFYAGIPVFFGSFTSLKYLNLSDAGFSGTIPQELRNLSSLQTLDLSWNSLSADNLEWLLPLQSLRNLHLTQVVLEEATDWLKSVSNLPLLRVLDLSQCSLPPVTPFLANSSRRNSSVYLSVIHLSYNYNLSSSFFTWLFNYSDSLREINLSNNLLRGAIPGDFAKMASLTHLDLSRNMLEGGIPSYFGNYCGLKSLALSDNRFVAYMPDLMKNLSGCLVRTLENLDLGANSISGPLPETIAEFSSLKYLHLSSNKLNGSIPKSYGQLPNLEILDFTDNKISGVVPEFLQSSSLRELYLGENQLSGIQTGSIRHLSNLEKLHLDSNHLEGIISESHLLNLSRLRILDFSSNSHLEFRLSSDWSPPFQLHSLQLRNCMIGPRIPKWLRTQKNIYEIDMSATNISGDTPSWLWNQMPRLQTLNLSYNSLGGSLPNLYTKLNYLRMLDLSSNYLKGPIPRLPKGIEAAHLSKNKFSGNITFLCNSSYKWLVSLDLSDNQLLGHLPDCWGNLDGLEFLNLANNRLSGKLFPPSMASLIWITALQLRNNSFTGKLPKSWKDFNQLNFVDLGDNRLSGSIPPWIGSYLSNVVVLDLSSNNFSGDIPKNICSLLKIQVLDLSRNKISGTIPKCINNFTAMTERGSLVQLGVKTSFSDTDVQSEISDGTPEALLMWKGIESKYKSTLRLVKFIDLSSNNLIGDIPLGITKLVGLVGLNLSRNHLTGTLTPEIGNLQSLDVLDLSSNQLSGEIPSSLSQLNQLGVLNLSYNDFKGRIPPNTRLQTYEDSAFAGNPGLCGDPLKQACPGDVVPQSPKFNLDEEEDEDKFITKGFYLSMMLGFIFGFWGVCGVLFFNRSSRHSFFRALNEMEDRVYVTIALKLAKLQRWFQG